MRIQKDKKQGYYVKRLKMVLAKHKKEASNYTKTLSLTQEKDIKRNQSLLLIDRWNMKSKA